MAKKKILDEKILLEKAKPILKKKLNIIERDIRKYSDKVIWDFYRDYEPYYYKRKFALPRIVGKSNYIEKNNGMSLILLYSSDELVRDYIDSRDNLLKTGGKHGKEAIPVFNNAFVFGYHGWKRWNGDQLAIRTRPSPWKQILKYVRDMYDGKEIK